MNEILNPNKEDKKPRIREKKTKNKNNDKIIVSQKKENRNKNKSKFKKNSFLFLIGGIVGIVNGFFGGGGGMICVPVLENFLKYPEKEAHATAISIIFPLSLLSAIVYVFNGKIQSIPLCLIGGGVLIGGIIGSFLLKILPSKVVGIIFSILMIFAGIRMII